MITNTIQGQVINEITVDDPASTASSMNNSTTAMPTSTNGNGSSISERGSLRYNNNNSTAVTAEAINHIILLISQRGIITSLSPS